MPSAERISRFVEAVRASGLLPAADLAAFAEAAAKPGADPELLARDLVRRGLLTAYQARRLWLGRGDDLVLNQYVLLDKVGEGAMGQVFRARHQRLDRDVALKVMRREKLDNAEAVRRFRREIRAASTTTIRPLSSIRPTCTPLRGSIASTRVCTGTWTRRTPSTMAMLTMTSAPAAAVSRRIATTVRIPCSRITAARDQPPGVAAT